MADMLSTGVSGLLAFQTALDTISNNISNVNTPGYDRETANLVTNTAAAAADGWIGNGVSVGSVARAYDQFLTQQTNTATSSYNQLSTVSTLANSINNMLADPTTGLSATLQSFSSAVQTMANAPSQNTTRQGVLTQAQALISQFQSYNTTFSQLSSQVNGEIGSQASTITSLGQSIASVNQQIMQAQNNGSGQAPNALLDERDNLINQLSQDVSVNTVTQSDGSISVFIGSGEALVIGASAATLTTTPDEFGSGQSQLSLQTSSGNVNITNSVTGGSLGGLLQFQQQMLTPGQNALGQAATTLTNLVNTQNEAGLDLSGAIGSALMTVGEPAVLPSNNNTGNASIAATVSNLGSLTTSNYYLRYDGTNWTMADAGSGAATALSASTSGGVTTLTGAGLTMTVTGTAQAGDRFLVEPTSNAVADMGLLTNDPSKIAAAGPLVTGASAGNTGTASIQSATVPNMSAWTRGDYTLSFSGPAAYTVTNAGGSTVTSGTYTPGSPISFAGINVKLTGTPAVGDSFTVDDNANGTGDNSNALLLANIMNQKVLSTGTQSLTDVVDGYVGTVGTQTDQAQNGATAQQSVMNSTRTAQQSISGVNLDQEAADMVQYEQAYQAAAQVIQAADTLFKSLLSAVQAS